jgi:hypothetical protein
MGRRLDKYKLQYMNSLTFFLLSTKFGHHFKVLFILLFLTSIYNRADHILTATTAPLYRRICDGNGGNNINDGSTAAAATP